MKTSLKRTTLAVGLAGMIAATGVHATPIQWTAGSGGNDHWYDLITTAQTWASALASAAAAGGYLVTITSSAENDFVLDTVIDTTLNTAAPAEPNNQHGFWAAGTDAAVEGIWRWAAGPESGNVISPQLWAGGEPNGGAGENALALNRYYPANGWNDANAGNLYGVVVEYDSIPEPASLALLGLGLAGLGFSRRKKA